MSSENLALVDQLKSLTMEEEVEEDKPKNPLFILPEVVWKAIFNHLKDPQDLLNCSRVCTTFENILQPSECTWLYPKVFPHLFPYLEKGDILSSRKVGKEWSKVIDGYLENHSYYLPYDENRNDCRHTTLYLPLVDKGFGWTELHNTKQLLSFMEAIKKPIKNPFIGRSVWVQYGEDNETDLIEERRRNQGHDFWPTCLEFLSNYGRYVWYFSMGTFGSRNTISRFIYLLRECLSRLPNLKSLHIFGWIMTEDELVQNEDNEEVLVFDWNNLGLNDDTLPEYLEQNPLPIVSSLETLEIEYMEDLPDAVYDHLIRAHANQLKCLQLTRWDFLSLNTSFPRLKELHIKLTSFSQLEKFCRRLSSPLGKLNLDFNFEEAELNLGRVFSLLSNRFENSLHVLQMVILPIFDELPPPTEDGWPRPPTDVRINLPYLQTLQLEGFNNLSLNFLLDVSQSLQHLHLRHLTHQVRTKTLANESIDVYHYINSYRVYESNIWTKLPKLKVISTEFFDSLERAYVRRFYNREMYDYLRRGIRNSNTTA